MTMLLRTKPLSDVVRGIIKRDNGVWLDASDLSTMYQDAAGTTPVTAMEQPVGKWLDKSGNGNHATQSITASRPVISARKNLLTKTEDFADAAWSKLVSGIGILPVVTQNSALAPDGTITAARVQLNKGAGQTVSDYSGLSQSVAIAINTSMNTSVWVKSSNEQTYTVWFDDTGGLSTGKNIIVTPVWKKEDISKLTNGVTRGFRLVLRGGAYATSDSADILIWHPQYEFGQTATRYQRVNTETDYDTAGFPKYLKFDGVDDYLNLPRMGLYANGSASIITSSSLLRQAANACTLGEGNTADADSLYCISRQLAADGNLDSVIIRDDATAMLDTTGSSSALADGFASVRAAVDTGANVKLHKNSQQLTSDDYTRSGVVTLNTTTIGAKLGTTAAMFNNLMLYGLIITKSAISDGDRRKCEVYLGRKAGVQL